MNIMKRNLPAIASMDISGSIETDRIFISFSWSPGQPLDFQRWHHNC